MNTLVQDNVNPIEKIERSVLITATTLHDVPPEELIQPEFVQTSKQYSPNLFQIGM